MKLQQDAGKSVPQRNTLFPMRPKEGALGPWAKLVSPVTPRVAGNAKASSCAIVWRSSWGLGNRSDKGFFFFPSPNPTLNLGLPKSSPHFCPGKTPNPHALTTGGSTPIQQDIGNSCQLWAKIPGKIGRNSLEWPGFESQLCRKLRPLTQLIP